MSRAVPPEGPVADENAVRIRTAAGKISVTARMLFASGGDRSVRALVARLFQHHAVRCVSIDRLQTLVEISYDRAVLSPAQALAALSDALRGCASGDQPSALECVLADVPGHLSRVKRRATGGRLESTIVAAGAATWQVLARLKKVGRNGSAHAEMAPPRPRGPQTSIRFGREFIVAYRDAESLATPGAFEWSGSRLFEAATLPRRSFDRWWQTVDVNWRPNWRNSVVFVDLYRLANLTAAGGCFLMAIVGAVTPGIPTVPFVLATSYFLARSSPTLNEKLKRSKLFGEMVRDWDQHRAMRISTKAKAVGLTVILIGITVSLAELSPVLLLVLLGFGSLGVFMVLRIPTLPQGSMSALPALA
jgi:uncharacterized membrane protein YbaN (DUF454 family)